MAKTVYILCALTCVGCAVLLFRTYLARKTRLVLWSSLCFACLAVNNGVLVADLIVWPETDLSLWRHLTALAAFLILVFGLVWDSAREGHP